MPGNSLWTAYPSPWSAVSCKRSEGRQDQVIDHLLCCALIEGRSCEKFQILAGALSGIDPELAGFYGGLVESEATITPTICSWHGPLRARNGPQARFFFWIWKRNLTANPIRCRCCIEPGATRFDICVMLVRLVRPTGDHLTCIKNASSARNIAVCNGHLLQKTRLFQSHRRSPWDFHLQGTSLRFLWIQKVILRPFQTIISIRGLITNFLNHDP